MNSFTIDVDYIKAKILAPYLTGEDLDKALALINEVEQDRYAGIDPRLQDVARACDLCKNLVIKRHQNKHHLRKCIVCRQRCTVVYSIGPTPLSKTYVCERCNDNNSLIEIFEQQMMQLGVKCRRQKSNNHAKDK